MKQGRWDDIHKHKVAPNNKILTKSWDIVLRGLQPAMKF